MNCLFCCPYNVMNSEDINQRGYYRMPVNRRKARAIIKGGPLAPSIRGFVVFTDVPGGTEVYTEISGLPSFMPAQVGRPQVGPFGFHIHQNGDCTVGNPLDPFKGAGGHWNPTNQPHGNHQNRESSKYSKIKPLCLICGVGAFTFFNIRLLEYTYNR